MESGSSSQPQSNFDLSSIGAFLQLFPERDDDNRLARMSAGAQVTSWAPAAIRKFIDEHYGTEHGNEWDPDYSTAYTTAYTTAFLGNPMAPRSESAESRTTAVPSPAPSTVFSRDTFGKSSASGATSNPPRHAPQQAFWHAPEIPSEALLPAPSATSPAEQQQQPPSPQSHPLWCEFCVLQDCGQRYRLDETADWIEHHREHMGDVYPARLFCWFCDHVPFRSHDVAAGGWMTTSRWANFQDRMEHIRAHIFDGMTENDMRPDFAVIEHMHKRGLISDHMRDTAMTYTELPESLRLPGMSSGSSRATPRTMPTLGDATARPVVHDLARERRLRRPRGLRRS